jgi:hypothetical protein
MGFSNLVKWVHETFQVDQFEPNWPYIDTPRPPVPLWTRIDDPRQILKISPTEELLIEWPGGSLPSQPKPEGFDTWSVDVLAYYLPYHFSRKRWGVYIRAHGIAYLSEVLKQAPLENADGPVLKVAMSTLFEHECFHFFAETATARIEFAARKRLYPEYFYRPEARQFEEALANAHAFRRTIRGPSIAFRAKLFAFMKSSPPGYSEFDAWLKNTQFRTGERNAAAHMMKPIDKTTNIPSLWPTEFLFGKILPSFVPTRLIMDAPLPWLRVVKPYPKFKNIRVKTHSNEHPPPHIHVESPPGRFKTRYAWPELRPLENDPPLSGAEHELLLEYLRKYRSKIHRRLETIYGQKLPMVTV